MPPKTREPKTRDPKPPSPRLVDCKGCETFDCFDNMGPLLGVGTPEEITQWLLNHLPQDCKTCKVRLSVEKYENKGKTSFRCRCRVCRKTSPHYTGTPFEGRRLSPWKLFHCLALFCNGVRFGVIWKLVGVSEGALRQGVVSILTNLIVASNFHTWANSEMVEVEVDETAVGSRKYNCGKRVRKNGTIWVAGLIAVDRAVTNRMIARVVEKRDAQTLLPLIKVATRRDAVVISDGWAAYKKILDDPESDRTHKVVNHSKEFVTDKGVHTNTIEGAWSVLKARMRATFGRVGCEDLVLCNSRLQVGVFFVNCSLDKKNPLKELFKLINDGNELLSLHEAMKCDEAERVAEARAIIEANKGVPPAQPDDNERNYYFDLAMVGGLPPGQGPLATEGSEGDEEEGQEEEEGTEESGGDSGSEPVAAEQNPQRQSRFSFGIAGLPKRTRAEEEHQAAENLATLANQFLPQATPKVRKTFATPEWIKPGARALYGGEVWVVSAVKKVKVWITRGSGAETKTAAVWCRDVKPAEN